MIKIFISHCAEDAPIAIAYGINHRRLSFILSGLCAAYAGVAGVFIALVATLAPSQIWSWVGVVFAVVIIGRLGNPVGALPLVHRTAQDFLTKVFQQTGLGHAKLGTLRGFFASHTVFGLTEPVLVLLP